MACNDCQDIKVVPVCTENLVLGKVASLTTAVFIYFKNISSGYQTRQQVTSAGDGTIAADLTVPDPSFYNPNGVFECWATLTTVSPETRLPITIGAIAYDCLKLRFEATYGEDDNTEGFTTATAEIE